LLDKLNENGIEVDFDLLKKNKNAKQEKKPAVDKAVLKNFVLDAEFDTGLPEG
jgi:hypothetical protein|tara:strand:+ start:479 stop:637 length:159 start_codon:yes stop_codon:yes gene_type:complete